ncbi:hypothetical protein C8Q80DRAFT_1203169 [Daedaleopsis nitida]|nr:hypothetical protein C8Q80DRAFT_1203169 [Daedaleopsis nitida]
MSSPYVAPATLEQYYSSVSEKSQVSLLHPTSPIFTSAGRYESTECTTPVGRIIQPGLFCYAKESSTPGLPEGWTTHIQPEGQRYFAHDTGRVVTDAYMYNPSVRAKIMHFAAVVAKILEEQSIHLPDSAELYLSPEEDEADGCGYYIADHASHTISWLEPVDSESMGIPNSVSESNLRFSLEELYWSHIELFPSHRIKSLHLGLDELISVFIQGESDQRTSQTSTFPYSAEQSKHHIRILQHAENITSPHTIWVIARLWVVIARHRQETYYAQERARLDRTQRILDLPMEKQRVRKAIFSATSRLLFGVPQIYVEQLETMWSDSLVYLNIWHDFMVAAQAEWRQYLTWSLGMSIINLLFFLVPGASSTLAGLSLACCAGAAIAAVTLLTCHHTTSIRTLDDATPLLIASRANQHRGVGLSFALPRALFLWATFLAGGQGLVWLARASSVYVIAALGWTTRAIAVSKSVKDLVSVERDTSVFVLFGAFAVLTVVAVLIRRRWDSPTRSWFRREEADQERDIEKA